MRFLRYGASLGSMACVMLAGAAVVCAADAPPASPPAAFQSRSVADKASYALGMSFARNFKGIEINPEMVMQGFRESIAGKPPLLTDREAQAVVQQFEKEVQDKMIEQSKVAGERAKKEGPVFLAANAKKPDVKTTASGLQYKILKQGTGKKATKDDAVRAHYRGTFLDGKEFDSSYSRGEPATFPVRGVIPGWSEALQLMPVGSKWQLFVPSSLAYGEDGNPPVIPGSSTLVFEIELLEVIAGQEENLPNQPRVRIQQ